MSDPHCVINTHGTGHPINNNETWIGSVIQGPFVWHYYATEPAI